MSHSEDWPAIRDRLRQVMDEKRLTLQHVADAVGVTAPALHMLLSGKTQRPYRRNQLKILKWLNDFEAGGENGEEEEETRDASAARRAYANAVGEGYRHALAAPPGKFAALDRVLMEIARDQDRLWSLLQVTTASTPRAERALDALGLLVGLQRRFDASNLPIPASIVEMEQRLMRNPDALALPEEE